ncbi:MAG: SUMF1/EgtB/PvdO family nonheme iron enzyme [Magnetococcales bacterium]|nr:SUMF1/EgtB/PvdO family nonheme iron enzyme [Magnetococcales bacterium]
MPPEKSRVIISYSHADAGLLVHFLPFLKTLEDDGLVTVWSDKDIRPGENWQNKITQKLSEAHVAVLLISQTFLASDFIRKVELPLLLSAFEQGKLTILPVFLSPLDASATAIPFTDSQGYISTITLADIQGYGTPEKTLEHHPPVEQKEIFKALNGRIRELVRQLPPDPNPQPSPDPYSDWAMAKFGRLSLVGVEGGDISLDLEKVFVPLGISQRQFGADLDLERRKGLAQEARDLSAGDIKLEHIFCRKDQTGTTPESLRQCVVLFGEPGAGKTTSLKKLLHLCLKQGSTVLGLPQGVLPVFLRLRHFSAEFLHQPLKAFLDKELSDLSAGRFPGELPKDYWARGRLLLLFDGLDEIADNELRAKVAKRINDQLVGLQSQHIYAAVSCRYAGYGNGVRLENFYPLDVRPLNKEQVEHFVTVWVDEACINLGPEKTSEVKAHSKRLLQSLDEENYADQRIQVLMGNPLLLTLLCVVILRVGEIPRRRADFYQKCLGILLGKWHQFRSGDEPSQQGGKPLLDLEEAMDILRPLAWKLHTEQRRDNVKRLEFANFAEARLTGKKGAPSGLKILEWLNRDTGVFIEYAPERYGFMHLGLQEYLAARHVVRESDDDTLLELLIGQADAEWWREVLLLLVGIPDHKLFSPLMAGLLPGILQEYRKDLLRDMLTEAVQKDFSPFVKLLQDKKTPVGQLTAILRLLKGVTDPAVLTASEGLKDHKNPSIAGLALGLLGHEDTATDKTYDLLVIHQPGDDKVASELIRMVKEMGLHPWPSQAHNWPVDTWLSHLDTIRDQAGAVLVLVDREGQLFNHDEVAEGLAYLGSKCRLIVFLPPGSSSPLQLPKVLDEQRAIVLDVRSNLDAGARATVNAVQGDGRPGRAIIGAKTDKVPVTNVRSVLSIAQDIPKPLPVAKSRNVSPATQHILEPLPGLRFLPVPGGTFTMGDDHGKYADEKPAHPVELSPFWLAETPVTNRHYALFLKATKKHKEPAYWRDQKFSDPDQPVVGVDWSDAEAFCTWLTQESGKKIVLPSEAQWEYAARGTDGRRYPWDNAEEPTKELACYDLDSSMGKPALVGQYPAGKGPFGHLDLAGNVWEWCRDVWDNEAYKKRAGRSAAIKDPVVSTGDRDRRSVRGGSWRNPAENLRAAIRFDSHAGGRVVNLGFRLAAPASTLGP